MNLGAGRAPPARKRPPLVRSRPETPRATLNELPAVVRFPTPAPGIFQSLYIL